GAIDAFRLHELIDRGVARMSMGLRQRLRLAMTFLPAPEVVLLDEPLTSLDAQGCELLLAAAAGVMARGGLILWCSPEEQPGAWFDARFTLEHGTVMPA